jgi:hypothetical protein
MGTGAEGWLRERVYDKQAYDKQLYDKRVFVVKRQ